MPNIESCRMNDEFDQEQIASILFGDGLIEDNSPSTQPDTRGWGDVYILPREKAIRAHFKRTAFVDYQEEFDLTENGDTITQTNLVNSEEVLVQELIYRIKISRPIPYREDLAKRLLALYYDAKEEDPDCVGIAAESLRSFNDFIHLHTNLKPPIISLTPDYNIYASWRDKQNRVFSVHFLPNADVRFVMFKPNVKRPERKIRVSGSATIDTLMKIVDPDCLEEWIQNEG
jgi:hypothetical protein